VLIVDGVPDLLFDPVMALLFSVVRAASAPRSGVEIGPYGQTENTKHSKCSGYGGGDPRFSVFGHYNIATDLKGASMNFGPPPPFSGTPGKRGTGRKPGQSGHQLTPAAVS
jgi:hypothetical protein